MKIPGIWTLQPLRRAFLQVNTDLNALSQVLEWFEQFNCSPTPPKAWLQCQLALAEGFTNAVRHAHLGQSTDLLIDLEVKAFNDCMEIRIWDQGAPFDLVQWLHTMPKEFDNEAEGGRGLRLMERIADVLTYTRTPDARNCLLIVKKHPAT